MTIWDLLIFHFEQKHKIAIFKINAYKTKFWNYSELVRAQITPTGSALNEKCSVSAQLKVRYNFERRVNFANLHSFGHVFRRKLWYIPAITKYPWPDIWFSPHFISNSGTHIFGNNRASKTYIPTGRDEKRSELSVYIATERHCGELLILDATVPQTYCLNLQIWVEITSLDRSLLCNLLQK